MGRGRERLINCAQCGRQVRRDKAVFIEKPIFTNPLDRDEVYDEQYTRMITREFAYCPSCGKHFRIYQKKTQQNQRARERERSRQFFQRRPYKPRETQGQATPSTEGAAAVTQDTNAESGEATNTENRIQTQAEEKELEAGEQADEEQEQALKESDEDSEEKV